MFVDLRHESLRLSVCRQTAAGRSYRFLVALPFQRLVYLRQRFVH
jgi:hypothetical protein